MGAFRFLVIAAAFVAAAVPHLSGAETPRDIDFLAAREAARAGDRAKFASFAALLEGHPLESYVGWWDIRLRIDELDASAVRATLDRHAGTYAAERARVDWLKALGKRGDWPTFGAEIQPLAAEGDRELDCYRIQHRRLTEGDTALAAARPLWFSGRETPEACEPLFDAMFEHGDLGSADVWARFRLAHESGRYALAARLQERLPATERIASSELTRIGRAPLKALSRADFKLKTQAGREALLYALQRAAKDSPEAARGPWVRVRDRLPRPDRLYGNLRLSYVASYRHVPEAMEWFREADGAEASDALLGWRARAALRAGAWPDVVAAVEAMSAEGRQDSTWRYWRARALRELDQTREATSEFGAIAGEPDFYGLLAAEELGRSPSLESRPHTPDSDALRAFSAQPEVRRALKLYALDMRREALQEWSRAIKGASDQGLLTAAEFARRNGIYDRAINAAERTRDQHDFGLRYLAPYRDVLSSAARAYDIEEALVLGLVRQESRFIPDIVSSAGAVGLMQLMPSTAKWVAKKLGRSDFRVSQVKAAEVNAEFGSFYLRYVFDRLDGMPVMAAAAYNAGPGRAQAWRANVPLEGAIYAETIPFSETRDYVKKVLANAVIYTHQFGLPARSLKDRLGVVPPRGGDSADATSGSATARDSD